MRRRVRNFEWDLFWIVNIAMLVIEARVLLWLFRF